MTSDEVITAQLRQAITSHAGPLGAEHTCSRACWDDVATRMQPSPIAAATLNAAWLDHWQQDPLWTWNTYSIAVTDHRCGPGCADPIAQRLG
jgi:hypothetical protein